MIDDSGEIGIAKGIIQIRYLAVSISGNRSARDIINRSGGLIGTFSYTLNIEKYTLRVSVYLDTTFEFTLANLNLSPSDSFRRFATRMDNFERESRKEAGRDDGRQGIGRGHRVWDGLPQNSATLRRPHCASSANQPGAGQCLRQDWSMFTACYRLEHNFSRRSHLVLVAASSRVCPEIHVTDYFTSCE